MVRRRLDQARRLAACVSVLALTTTLAGVIGVVATAAAPSGEAGPDTGGWAVPQPPATLRIDTEGAAPVVSKDDYLSGSLALDGTSYPLEIKGRGNSTWKWPKKPYKLKLEAPAALLGLPANDEWVLLANYADRSALRNHLALQLARRTRLAWSPDSRFVELVLNGEPRGLYLLTDQVELGPDRVVLPEEGYLLEVDQRFRASGDPGFRTRRRTPVSFKDPDELTVSQRRQVKRAVNEFEDVLYGDHFADPVRGYQAHVDVDTFVDWYLVEEFFRNQDSNFYSSVNVTWVPGEGFAMGPVWDFDLSAGTRWNAETTPQGWHTRRGRHWIARMMEDPAFSARVKDRWAELLPLVAELVDQVPAVADVVRPAAAVDWQQWHLSGSAVVGGVHADTHGGEVDYLRAWLRDRARWMSGPEVVFGRASGRVRERDVVLEVPVRVLAGDRPVTVHYSFVGGKATLGEDFTMTDGTLRFAPGESIKTFPLTLHSDLAPEAEEKIHLALRSAEGARLGHPQRLAVTLGASDLRPDAQIRRAGRGDFVGAGVHHRRGRGQTVRTAVRRGASQGFDVRLANPAGAPGDFTVRGSGAGPGVEVRYYLGRAEVTDEVRSAKGWPVRVAAGRAKQLRAEVRVRPGARTGVERAVRITSIWKGDRRAVDTVRATLRLTR